MPALRHGADEETWIVDEVDRRNVEGVAEVDEADHLLGCRGIHRSAALFGVVGHHADGIAVEARESDDSRAAVHAPYLWAALPPGANFIAPKLDPIVFVLTMIVSLANGRRIRNRSGPAGFACGCGGCIEGRRTKCG